MSHTIDGSKDYGTRDQTSTFDSDTLQIKLKEAAEKESCLVIILGKPLGKQFVLVKKTVVRTYIYKLCLFINFSCPPVFLFIKKLSAKQFYRLKRKRVGRKPVQGNKKFLFSKFP